MKNILKVSVKSFYRDHGDGSGSSTVYRDKQHFLDVNTKGEYPRFDNMEEAELAWEKAESGESEYDYGSLHDVELHFELRDGKLMLMNNPHFPWGS